jgi:hypothetical protein
MALPVKVAVEAEEQKLRQSETAPLRCELALRAAAAVLEAAAGKEALVAKRAARALPSLCSIRR